VVVVSACTSPVAVSRPSTTGDGSSSAAPLARSFDGPGTSWAILAMGHLGDPVNTFWEMFHWSGGSSPWELATPPGVASNGGLVAAVSSSGTVTAGFEPSQGLRFSPLSQTPNLGATWSQGLVPGALAPVPDALATSVGPHYLASVRTGGGEIVANSGDLTSWTTVATRRTLATDPSTSSCVITGLTGVTYSTGGDPVVGTGCARGSRPGIFESVSGEWRSVGPTLPASASGPIRVLRLYDTPAGVAALVSTGKASDPTLFALWSNAGMKTWQVSAGLPLTTRAPSSTGDTATGELVVATDGDHGQRRAAVISPSSGRWRELAEPPAGTSTIAVGPDGTFDALIAEGSTLVVDSLGPGGWHRTQALNVEIQYGSSG
jgi:hypothetical protein